MPRDLRSRQRSRAALAASLLALTSMAVPIADACGLFVRDLSPEQRPSLAREKVLIIHDRERGQQHFVREVAFARAGEPFGFVVPTPTRPSVAALTSSPFTGLRSSFPFTAPPEFPPGGGGTGPAYGGHAQGVEVLSVERVGSFTAFVLSATDERGLAEWLAANQLLQSDATEAWLAHYVRMGFYYVALRWEPPKPNAASLASETIVAETLRISFATPIPYYPYLEPDAEPDAEPASEPRLLELWMIGTAAVEPIALREHEGRRRWVRPLRAGQRHDDARAAIEAALEPELEALLPAGPLVLQTFQDQKSARPGFADVLFATLDASTWTPAQLAALEPMLGVLDPALVPAKAEAAK
ncbi:DUF2330 domain-containing protein [Nannocystaceae bacterium ST9]